MKSRMAGFLGRLTLTIVMTVMFVFGGLLIVTSQNDDAHAGHYKKYKYVDGNRRAKHKHVTHYPND